MWRLVVADVIVYLGARGGYWRQAAPFGRAQSRSCIEELVRLVPPSPRGWSMSGPGRLEAVNGCLVEMVSPYLRSAHEVILLRRNQKGGE